MGIQSSEPLRSYFGGRGLDQTTCALFRKMTIITTEDEVADDTVELLRFKSDQIAPADLVRELQIAISDDVEALNAEQAHDMDLISEHFSDRIDGDFEIRSPFVNDGVKCVNTIYVLRLPSALLCPLYEMQGKLNVACSEQIEMQIRRGLSRAGVPLPRVRDKGLGF